MAIFTAFATTVLGLAVGSFAASAFVTVASLATSIALSYAAKALSGSAPLAAPDNFGIQGQIQASGNVPRSFNFGYSITAGSLVYANTWGNAGETPNAFLTQVIALSDLPGGTLEELWVNGELVTVEGVADGDRGYPITEYRKAPAGPHLWVKFYDGTQTTADALCVSVFGSDPDRPYTTTRVGTGVAYAVVTALVEETLFTGFPTFKFALSGVPLYDPSKDSSVGGSGSHDYSDPDTWGGDGDDLPAVQIYNILRGMQFDGAWQYGLQQMTAARLPAANWIEQIEKCRDTITGTDGPEPTYRSGGQIDFSAQPANAIEALLTACQGKLSELGGSYKIHLGTPDSTSFTFTDDDIISTEQQVYRPFFALAESVNGIQATYPDPAQGWNTATAPAYYRTDLEVLDGGRRLLVNPSFDFVPYAAQVQRLQKSAIEEAQRARTHTIVLPPKFWTVEPGDVLEWTSERNGYVTKQFRADAIVDQNNLNVGLSLTEVDPADYDWDHGTEFVPTTSGPTTFVRPSAQGVLDWAATGTYLIDDNGITRRPAIEITWDGTLPGIIGVQYEVRLVLDNSSVARGRTDQYEAGALIVTQGLVGLTTYEIRGQYIPSQPRDMLWSDWIEVVTPDVTLSLADFDAALKAQVTTIFDALNDKIDYATQQIAALASDDMATNWLDKKRVRDELSSQVGAANASIVEVKTVQVSDQAAFASYQVTVSASFDSVDDDIAAVSSSVTVNSTAIATLNGYAAAQYSVTLDVNGYASGFNLINGGPGFSTFTIVADKIQFQLPGYNGGAPYPFLTTGTVGGVASIGIRGNLYLDGTLYADALVAGTITSLSGKIGALSVDSLSIADNAVTIPAIATSSTPVASTASYVTILNTSLSIVTTGLSGKSITVYASFTTSLTITAGAPLNTYQFYINGTAIITQIVQSPGPNNTVTLSCAYTFTASGGTDTIPVRIDWKDSLGGGTVGTTSVTDRILFAQAGKR